MPSNKSLYIFVILCVIIPNTVENIVLRAFVTEFINVFEFVYTKISTVFPKVVIGQI